MRNTFFSRHCAWAARWPWRTASRQSGADLASNWCILQSKGNLDTAYADALRYSAALQLVPGVERAWAQHPGVVYVVLEGNALVQLALDDHAMPYKDSHPGRWLIDYGAVPAWQDVGLSHARQNVLADVLARALVQAGHKVVRERFAFDDGPTTDVLCREVQEAMQAIERDKTDNRSPLMLRLAEQALRMDVPSNNTARIDAFARTSMFARQEEHLAQLRVEFDKTLLSSQLRVGVCDAIAGWHERGLAQTNGCKTIFHATAFGGRRELVVTKANGKSTYAAERVAHHALQLAHGFSRVVSVRDTNHNDIEQNARLGLEALCIESGPLSYLLVQPVLQGSGNKMIKRQPQVTAHDAVVALGANALRLGLLGVQPKAPLHVHFDQWRDEMGRQERTFFAAVNKAQGAVQTHCKGVANMQSGPVAHAAKPLVLALLRWPDCHRLAIQTLNPTLVYRHAMELVHLIHKTHANVPMQELDGPALEAMGTLWALVASQLLVVLGILGIDILQWQDKMATR